MSTLLVVGSANADHVLTFDELPQAGQTLISQQYRLELGGKGANQAVAAVRLKNTMQQVYFISALGDDSNAATMRTNWTADGIDLSGCYQIAKKSTGTAVIFVNQYGENSIGVVPGANAYLSAHHIQQQHALFAQANYLLIQLETSLESVHQALILAKQNHCTTILNPAPATKLNNDLLNLIDIITPNETEALALTGIEVIDQQSAQQAAQSLHSRGVNIVIITLGSKGAYISEKGQGSIIPTPTVNAIDTVAAGDTFNGALMVALDEGKTLIEAVEFANLASSIAVTRNGAQSSIPYRKELT
ncbi:ribokinase [Shewanella livingstonensis]|uniref:Ribokinase n=1 Tax=Shewanella livingstonensis TaxID=150120 RepID=A0A3G8LRE1_9GAMM|nr:ribokinase [Shewanella livingstonensis]AZG71442.1 ribokinase [Shewanella livingstonensis]